MGSERGDESIYDAEDFDDARFIICPRCHGEGEYVTCPDDMCRGAGECLHGDGMEVCRVCDGDGEVECTPEAQP